MFSFRNCLVYIPLVRPSDGIPLSLKWSATEILIFLSFLSSCPWETDMLHACVYYSLYAVSYWWGFILSTTMDSSQVSYRTSTSWLWKFPSHFSQLKQIGNVWSTCTSRVDEWWCSFLVLTYLFICFNLIQATPVEVSCIACRCFMPFLL